MCSPRNKCFYSDLASTIRTERMLTEQARKDETAEARALQERLLRLEKWEYVLEQPEVTADCVRRLESEMV